MDHGVGFGKALETLDELRESWEFLHSTATRTTGDTENFMWRVSLRLLLAGEGRVLGDERVEAHHGDGVTAGNVLDDVWRRPMQSTVRWMDLT